jgi:hypothetical protein
MYFFILGFHRFAWWPKCTPASNNSFIVIVDIASLLQVFTSAPIIPGQIQILNRDTLPQVLVRV